MKNKTFLKILTVIIVFFAGAVGMYLIIYFFPAEFISTINTTKVVKDVSITDTGLSEAVDKIYDAVVVVETYVKDELSASGTGFVYKSEDGKGYILTNNHVISGGTKIYVTFTNGKRLLTEVLGSDSYADIAVLSIDSFDDMAVASLGSSEDAKVGDTVFTVGAPLDSAYSWTVTRGILSGKDRLIEVNSSSSSNSTSDWVMSALQTDAAINSGNSGGPLANANGEVIGITSLKLVKSGVEGMGFAIPIETALDYADKIENNEEIKRPYLGVSMYNISEINTKYYDSDTISAGVYIAKVESSSPAAKAGLKEGDVIVKLNNTDIENVAYLKYNLYKYEVGEKISLTIYRDNEKKTIEVTLGESSN
jgi:serine protease Do